MRRVQVFDVNETLLDPAAFDPHFQRVFGDAGMRRVWFQQMIQSALVATVTGPYRSFGEIGLAALAMTAEQAGVEVRTEDRDAIAAQLRRLPAHPEVPGALERLRRAGYRLATLTNSTEEVARAQLEHAGIIDAFEQVLSADTVRRLKPAPEPYLLAAERLGVPVGEVRLVAAHAWGRCWRGAGRLRHRLRCPPRQGARPAGGAARRDRRRPQRSRRPHPHCGPVTS